jgi:WD40 repeat protein
MFYLWSCWSQRDARAFGLVFLFLLSVFLSSPVLAQESDPLRMKAEADLKDLRRRPRNTSEERARLRADLLTFRRTYPGTDLAIEAARLLKQLPSPLDQLDPKNIPELEKFSWQPKELVAILGEHRGRHGAEVRAVAVSSDSKLVASGGQSLVRIWDASTMRLKSLLGHSHTVTSVVFSPDTKKLVVGGGSGLIRVWDISDPEKSRLYARFRAGSGPVYGVDFHPEGKLFAAASFSSTIHLYDVSGPKGKEVLLTNAHDKPITALVFAPDGKSLVTGSNDLTLRLWVPTGKDLQERGIGRGHSKGITALAYAPTGRMLASADSTGTILLWSPASLSRPRLTIPSFKSRVYSLAFSRTGSTLAAAYADGTTRLYAVSPRPRERARLFGHLGAVQAVAFSPDGKTLITGGKDYTVRAWDLTGRNPSQRFEPWSHLSRVYSLAFSPDDTNLATGSLDQVVRLWDVTQPQPKTVKYLKDLDAPVYAVAYSPDGSRIAAGGKTTTVRQWETSTARLRLSLTDLPNRVEDLTYTPDGQHLITQSPGGCLLWDAVRSQVLHRFEGEEERFNCIALSPDGKRLAYGCGQRLYKDGKPVFTEDRQPVYTECVIRLFDVQEGRELAKFDALKVPVYNLTFTADGQQLFAGVYEAKLQHWEVGEEKLTEGKAWEGVHGYVSKSVASPDGRYLITRGVDSRLIQWDRETGKRLKQWVIPETITSLAVTSDSRHLALGFATGVIYVLRLETL